MSGVETVPWRYIGLNDVTSEDVERVTGGVDPELWMMLDEYTGYEQPERVAWYPTSELSDQGWLIFLVMVERQVVGDDGEEEWHQGIQPVQRVEIEDEDLNELGEIAEGGVSWREYRGLKPVEKKCPSGA